MGSDLHMTPPSLPQYRLVTAENYAALYERQTDVIYGQDRVDYWHRVYMTTDRDEEASNAMEVVLGLLANGRYRSLRREDLCKRGADEPFAESYPREELQADDPLAIRKLELERELAEVNQLIQERGTK